jgi:uncharacterized protein (TIGR00251 family)
MGFAREADGGARLVISAKPGSSKEGIVLQAELVVVRVAPPPADGRANARVVDLVAERLGVARSRVQILRGASGRRKELFIDGMTSAAVDDALKNS